MKLAALFSHHMVLQRDMPIPVWGWAQPGSEVAVELAGHCSLAIAGADGKWMARLPSLPATAANESHTLTARTQGEAVVEITDVLVDEVWLCSGQSNMEFSLSNVMNAEEEIAQANHPRIRLFQVPKIAATTPQCDVNARWEPCTPDSAHSFSAVAYFHGLELERRLGVPVGLIHSSWGGTIAEAWTSRDGLLAVPAFRSLVADQDRLLSDSTEAEKVGKQYSDWEETYAKRPAPHNIGVEQGWAMPEQVEEESAWLPITMPCYWQQAGLNFNGVLWFRREVEIPSAWAGRDLILNIGPCDKSEWTYFNGEPIGSLTLEQSADAWWTPRVYTVPGRLVKPGKNVIAVRIFSQLYLGGMSGPAEVMSLLPKAEPKAEAISLSGTWLYRVEHNFGIIPPAPPRLPGSDNPQMPWVLYAGMIAPLVPYGMRGAIWYQGESNANRANEYRTLFPALIADWRRLWGQEHFHFHFVQLANYMSRSEEPGESQWAELREAQTMALALPDTAMAVAIDIGEEIDIHPKNKRDVGRRLAWSALAQVYGCHDVEPSGPLYTHCQIERFPLSPLQICGGAGTPEAFRTWPVSTDTGAAFKKPPEHPRRSQIFVKAFMENALEGSQVRLFFKGLGGGLEARGGKLEAFALAGEDRKFYWADARIEGDTVVVFSPQVSQPKAVRYGWADNPPCNLYNRAGLPASPFRTDDWKA